MPTVSVIREFSGNSVSDIDSKSGGIDTNLPFTGTVRVNFGGIVPEKQFTANDLQTHEDNIIAGEQEFRDIVEQVPYTWHTLYVTVLVTPSQNRKIGSLEKKNTGFRQKISNLEGEIKEALSDINFYNELIANPEKRKDSGLKKPLQAPSKLKRALERKRNKFKSLQKTVKQYVDKSIEIQTELDTLEQSFQHIEYEMFSEIFPK